MSLQEFVGRYLQFSYVIGVLVLAAILGAIHVLYTDVPNIELLSIAALLFGIVEIPRIPPEELPKPGYRAVAIGLHVAVGLIVISITTPGVIEGSSAGAFALILVSTGIVALFDYRLQET